MNVDNRTLFITDNLDIMRGMDSETIDLIYLDPPFNSKKQYKAPSVRQQKVQPSKTSGRMKMSETAGIAK